MQGIDEVKRIRGYYAASAGLSYASVILAGSSEWSSPISVKNSYPYLWQNLGLKDTEDVAIVITKRQTSVNGVDVIIGFDITSTFSGELGHIKVTGFVPKFGLPKTDQTISYQDGDDGAYQTGRPAPSLSHYQDNLDGTITDNATGLMWVKNPSLCGGSTYPNTWASDLNKPNIMTWANAITNCEALDYAGHNDWRLPNIKELVSIVNFSRQIPAVDPTIFTVAPTYFDYWSSTTSSYDTSFVWAVEFCSGSMGGIKRDGEGGCKVRPVRGGQ